MFEYILWEKDIDDRFLEKLQEERQHTYETDEEDSGEESDDEEDLHEEEAYTTDYVTGDKKFYDIIIQINQKWDEWDPQDPVKRLLKHSIEKTEHRLSNQKWITDDE